ncbi:unnamed protein product [Effrenium voratum]|nr:unnamed protein product [Effrenium voratum]
MPEGRRTSEPRRRSMTVAEQAKATLEALAVQAGLPKKSAVEQLHEIAYQAGCSSVLRAWYFYLDKDQSGRIDYKEFDKGLKDMKFTGSKEDTLKLWQELDSDASGEISFDEFAYPAEGLGFRSGRAMRWPWLPLAAATCDSEFLAGQKATEWVTRGVGASEWVCPYLPQFLQIELDFMEYTAFPFKVARGEQIPKLILDFFEMEGDPYIIQLKKYASWAHQMLMACWTVGGRLWEVRLHWNTSTWFEGRVTGDLNEMHTTICAPAVCNPRQVVQQVAPRVAFANPEVMAGGFWGKAVLLSSWQFAKVSFAIVGTGGCGTTSIRKNLEAHKDIRFTHSQEDVIYAPGYRHEYLGGFRSLPTAAQVNMINCGRPKCKAESNEVVGVKNYNLYNFDFGLVALSMVNKVTIIVVVCDPLDRLEKTMHFYHCGFQDESRCRNRSVIDEIMAGTSVADLVQKHKEHWIASERLPILTSMFKDVIVVHQQLLRENPESVYRLLFRRLGLVPPKSRYHRYNSYGGQRTGLCSHKKLFKEFQKELEPEYARLEEMLGVLGHPRVPELAQRTGRCARLSELRQARRCVNERCD